MDDTTPRRAQRASAAKDAAKAPVTDSERDVRGVATVTPAAARQVAVAQIRRQIVDLKRERDALDAIRANRRETAQVINETVDAWREHGTATLRAVLASTARSGHIDADAFRLPARGPADLGPMLVALLGAPAVEAALLAHLDAVPDAADTAGRAARRAEIDAALFRLECEEEAAIEASEDTDAEPIRRRADADPRAVLALPGGDDE